MKRTPLQRKTPLKRTTGLKRTKRINPISAKMRVRMAKLARIEPPEDGCCQDCHQTPDFRGLAKHHVVFRSQGGSDEQSNLLWLCGKCHSKRHRINEVQ